MKLCRYGTRHHERPGIWMDDGVSILDVRTMASDIEDYDAHFFRKSGIARLKDLLHEPGLKLVDREGLRLGPPVARPGKIICLGKNYVEHAEEFDSEVPALPIFFAKASSSLSGPYDPIVLPPGADSVDLEAELALVIGRPARNLTRENAMEAVAGYATLNDVTDRKAQRAHQQWFRGKSADGFCPLGPFLVPAREVPDPHALRVSSSINGEALQDGNTAQLIFNIPSILVTLSETMTLEPGDIISTGTPAGVGFAQDPPRCLKAGDHLVVSVEGIGEQRASVRER